VPCIRDPGRIGLVGLVVSTLSGGALGHTIWSSSFGTAFSGHGVAVTVRYNTPEMTFRHTRRIWIALVVIAASCSRNAPVPVPPPPNIIPPDWGHVTKTSNCVVMNRALPDSGCTPGNTIGSVV